MSDSTLDLPLDRAPQIGKGHGTGALGPSDNSDSGSDLQGAGPQLDEEGGVITPTGRALGDADLDSDTDSTGTGEVAMAGRDAEAADSADLGTDRVVGAEEAGLGGGLDQAEEARLGRRDEDTEPSDAAMADGVVDAELMDQMRSGSDSETDTKRIPRVVARDNLEEDSDVSR